MNCRKPLLIVLLSMVVVVVMGFTNCQASQTVIHRDSYGVPHIYSGDLDGLYFGFGYAVAQDRLFQLEVLKRINHGTVSEIFGSDYVAFDNIMRRDNLTQAELRAQYLKLDKKYQKILKAYADGINAWIDKVLADKENLLPLEFHQLGFEPKHWTELDATAPYFSTLGWFMDLTAELQNAELYTYLTDKYGYEGQSYFNDLVWGDDPGAYATIQTYQTNRKHYTPYNQLALLDRTGLAQSSKKIKSENTLVSSLLQNIGIEAPDKFKNRSDKLFSYCTVIGPTRSETGSPLLMGGPQFGFWLPSMLHEVGLHGAGIDVVGSTLAGTPFIQFGHSRHTAFGSTAGADNLEDIFEERLNPLNPNQYYFKGQWRDMTVRTERIPVKGQSPIEVQIYSTVHGPVIDRVDTNGDGTPDIAYTKALACRDEYVNGIVGFIDLMVAQTPEDFIKAGEANPLSINFFWADNKGNIGYYHCGKYPIRPATIDPRFPIPGTGEFEWLGFMAHEDHPYVINPANGLLLNWNNKPTANWDNGDLAGIFAWAGWSEDHRVNRIRDVVAKEDLIGMQDLEELIRDISDFELKTAVFKDYLLEALSYTNEPELVKAKQLIASWDNYRRDKNNDGYYDSTAYALYQQWWNIVNEKIFADELGPYWPLLTESYAGYSLFLRVIKGYDATLPLQNDFLNGASWENIFIESMREAIANLTVQYGTADMNQWLTATKTMQMIPANLLGIPASFGEVAAIKYMDRGTENHLVSLERPFIKGKNILPPGQNGFINKYGVPGAHFSDQLSLFAEWKYKDMLFKRDEVLSNSESVETLHYSKR